MKKALLLIAGLAFATYAISAEKAIQSAKSESTGWQDFKFGWTQKELVSSGKPIMELKASEESTQNGGMYAVYGLENYEVAGRKFDVKFWFGKTSDHLEQISLSLVKGSQTVANSCPVLHKALTEKYGVPLHTDRLGNEAGIVKKGFWKSSQTSIDMICITGLVEMMSITYQPVSDSGV